MSGAFSGERALVVGLARSGFAAARALAEEGAVVRATEERSTVEGARRSWWRSASRSFSEVTSRRTWTA